MNKERLQTLINILKRADAAQFSLSNWQDGWADLDENTVQTEDEMHLCGTIACVGGWLAVSPEFKAVGGTVLDGGSPMLHDDAGYMAMKTWLECTTEAAYRICGFTDFDAEAGFYGNIGQASSDISLTQVITKLETLL
jgi:hypothetical protein